MVEFFGHPVLWAIMSILWGIVFAMISHAVIPKIMGWRWRRRLQHLRGVKKVIWHWDMMMIFADSSPPKDAPFTWPYRTLWYRIQDDEQLRILE